MTGSLGAAVRAWSESLQDLSPADRLLVAVAIDAADVADECRDSAPDALMPYWRAVGKLLQTVNSVERKRVNADDGNDDDGGNGADDAWSRELAVVLGSAPTVGNSADQ